MAFAGYFYLGLILEYLGMTVEELGGLVSEK
jgi:hypothetical protein